MRVLTWFNRRDSVIVEQSTVLRVLDFDAHTLKLALEDPAGAVTGELDVGYGLHTTVHDLEVRYTGLWPRDDFTSAKKKAGIEFQDVAVVDVRRHSFAGEPIGGERRMGAR